MKRKILNDLNLKYAFDGETTDQLDMQVRIFRSDETKHFMSIRCDRFSYFLKDGGSGDMVIRFYRTTNEKDYELIAEVHEWEWAIRMIRKT